MGPYLDELYGNPSSVHHVGRRVHAHPRCRRGARRHRLAESKPTKSSSPGREALKATIWRFVGTARIACAKRPPHRCLQHRASCCPSRLRYLQRKGGFDVTYLPVTSEGRPRHGRNRSPPPRPDTILVSVMAANNEIGTLQPVPEIGELCRERGVLFHTDAAQYLRQRAICKHSPVQRRPRHGVRTQAPRAQRRRRSIHPFPVPSRPHPLRRRP